MTTAFAKKFVFSVLTVAVVLSAFVIAFKFISSSRKKLYSEKLNNRVTLTIWQYKKNDQYLYLHCTYHNPPAIGTIGFDNVRLRSDVSSLTFKHVYDLESGIHVVHDLNDIGFLFLFDSRTGDYWITGRHGSSLGKSKQEVANWLEQVKRTNPGLSNYSVK